jgi:hypothetical protein
VPDARRTGVAVTDIDPLEPLYTLREAARMVGLNGRRNGQALRMWIKRNPGFSAMRYRDDGARVLTHSEVLAIRARKVLTKPCQELSGANTGANTGANATTFVAESG